MARAIWCAFGGVVTGLILTGVVGAGPYEGANPYEPEQSEYRTDLLVVGGSSAATAAALTAGRLGIPTVWTLRAPRDLGGLSTNAINPDSDLPIRYLGGLALEYDVVARFTTGYKVGGRHHGEGFFAPFHVFFNYTRQQFDGLPCVVILANLYPVAVHKDPASRRVTAVEFGHRLEPHRRVTIYPKLTIDAEIEGDVAFLAGVSMTLCREARTPSDDPTRHQESYAGRIFTPERPIGSLLVAGGPPMDGSTFEADARPATMAWNGSVTLKDYGQGGPDSPWVLVCPPTGYDPRQFEWWTTGIYGVLLGGTHRRWNIDRFLSTVEGWRLPDGRHVLESMDIRDREANEKAHLAHVLCGLWHLQHVKKQYRYGLADDDFHEGLVPKYWLSDFGTRTHGGDVPLPGLIYMREGRRMQNDHVFGGKLIEDDGSGRFLQKRYWHARAVYYNAMLIDIHGVHLQRQPGSGPEGMQLLRLAGYPNFGVPCIPFDVLVPRPREATGLLVASAGAYTHQAYAAFPRMETGRILQGHACAVAAWHALRDGVPVHLVDVRKVQLTGLRLHGQSIVYFDDTIPGTDWHVVDQMLGARRVPERNDQGVFQREDYLTLGEARTYLERLFREYTDHPVPAGRLRVALHLLAGDDALPALRGRVLAALSAAAGLEIPEQATRLFANVEPQTRLGRILAAWAAKGWIAPHAEHAFGLEKPMPFWEFKRHAYHVLFGELAPQTVRPVDYRPWLAHDTFNRADGPLTELSSGQAVWPPNAWGIRAGCLTPDTGRQTTYLLVDVGQPDVDLAADLFLEQTRNPAAAGLVVRALDERNMHRFVLQAEGPAVILRIDTLVDGQRTAEVRRRLVTLRRGFTLRLVARGHQLAYFLDGAEVHRQARPEFRQATRVGLVNGGGEASRFDNLEVRP